MKEAAALDAARQRLVLRLSSGEKQSKHARQSLEMARRRSAAGEAEFTPAAFKAAAAELASERADVERSVDLDELADAAAHRRATEGMRVATGALWALAPPSRRRRRPAKPPPLSGLPGVRDASNVRLPEMVRLEGYLLGQIGRASADETLPP